ncbi:MAG: hypothetical protein K5770_03425 [Lachnospiraceae bacterium]|nr:hypothetical protein [Lachnospiraceae bacterium]
MELTVYRQAYKERPDGTVVYKGEDALPFVNDKVILVADGLGGAAAIRHQKIRPELFDTEKIAEVLFPEFCGEACSPEFIRYVKDSFFELFAVKDCYTDNINNIKKSGYFASRLVAAIMLFSVLYRESSFSVENLIESLASKTGEERDRLLKESGGYFKGIIQDELRKCAGRANLTYESAYSGLALLGTTLCMTLFRETDESIQAACLTAGDSRPYTWSEEEGLCQLLPDEEGPDGGMTNYILANDDADFSVRCDYFEFAKPCILFNASDGCFDSGYFLSPMAFEKLILDTALGSGSPEEMGGKLTEIFREYGRHDDSSTIAMRMFGYESFEALKESAGRRLSVLEKDYLSKLPGLLEEDYRREAENENDQPEEPFNEAEDGTSEAFLKANLQEALFNSYELSYSRYMMT